MKILVTGGAGFIGSHVVDRYIEEGHKVAVVDNLSTGFERNLNPKATFYKVDICDRKLGEVFEKEKLDIVNHHAAQMDVRKSTKDPVFDAQVNILGSLNLIASCVNHGVKKLIYASTGGAVYGEPDYRPVDEKHPIRPLSQYGISKHTVEHYLVLYSAHHNLKYTVLRYPNVFGPRQNPWGEAGVVAIFTRQLLEGEQATIFGDGTKTRDYTYISDVVESNILSLKKGDNQILNIGMGKEASDQEIYDGVARVLDSQAKPKYASVRPGEINHICLDAHKAAEELNWAPKVSFEDGLKMTVDYLKSHQS